MALLGDAKRIWFGYLNATTVSSPGAAGLITQQRPPIWVATDGRLLDDVRSRDVGNGLPEVQVILTAAERQFFGLWRLSCRRGYFRVIPTSSTSTHILAPHQPDCLGS